MKEKIRYFIAGIFIGLSELLPGISGATVALMFGVYERLIDFLRRFKNLDLILPLLFGMILSVFAFSSLIDFLYKNFTNSFNLFIALLMIGYGTFLVISTYIKEDIDKGKSFYINFFLAIIIGLHLSSFHIHGYQEPILPLIVLFGFIACIFLLFPGISGSVFLVYVGAHSQVIGAIASLDFSILLPYGAGILISLAIMPRLIKKVYEKYGQSILVFFGGLIFAAGVNHFL